MQTLLLGLLLGPRPAVVAMEPKSPVVVVLIDDSLSMAEADPYAADKELRTAAEKLVGKEATRLVLAQALLTRSDGGWLAMLADRGYRLHLYHLDAEGGAERLCAISDPKDKEQLKTAVEKVRGLRPHAPATRLGEALHTALGDFRARPLAAVVLLSDGVTTGGEGLYRAVKVRDADLPGAPLFGVLLGDPRHRPEVRMEGVDHEEEVTVADRLTLDVTLNAIALTKDVDVRLDVREKDEDRVVSSRLVRLEPNQRLPRARITFPVTDVGEKTYTVQVMAPKEVVVPVEHQRREVTILVQPVRPLRVLLVEGGPGFEYRSRYNLLRRLKGVDVRLLLQDADPDAVRERPDLTAELPGSEELAGYDVVLFGDVDPLGPGLGRLCATWPTTCGRAGVCWCRPGHATPFTPSRAPPWPTCCRWKSPRTDGPLTAIGPRDFARSWRHKAVGTRASASATMKMRARRSGSTCRPSTGTRKAARPAGPPPCLPSTRREAATASR
jgi:hypothetical protein